MDEARKVLSENWYDESLSVRLVWKPCEQTWSLVHPVWEFEQADGDLIYVGYNPFDDTIQIYDELMEKTIMGQHGHVDAIRHVDRQEDPAHLHPGGGVRDHAVGSEHNRPGSPRAEGDVNRADETKRHGEITQADSDRYTIYNKTGMKKYAEPKKCHYRIPGIRAD